MKYLLFFISICLASPVNLRTVTDGKVIKPSEVNQYYSALTGKILPRGSNGVVSDLAGALGSATYRWEDGWFSTIYFGDSASNTYLTASATELKCFVGGVQKCSMTSSGFDGAYLASDSVSQTALNNGNFSISSSSGSFTTTSTSYTAVTNLSASITTNGRPVIISLQDESGSSVCSIGLTVGAAGDRGYQISIKRDSTVIYETLAKNFSNVNTFSGCGGFVVFDTPSEGTYTYSYEGKVLNALHTLNVTNAEVVVREI